MIDRVVTSLIGRSIGWSRSWIVAKRRVVGLQLLLITNRQYEYSNSIEPFQPPSVTTNLRSGLGPTSGTPCYLRKKKNLGIKFNCEMQL